MSENLNKRGVLIHEFVYRNWLHFLINLCYVVKIYYKIPCEYIKPTIWHSPHVVMGERNP